MILRLQRFFDDGTTTLGHLSLDGTFLCFTAEDTYRKVKVDGKTRIPNGIYKIGLRTEGGKHQKYLKKFPDFHKGMIWIQDIPDFEFVYFHVGNKASESEGCPLVGNGANTSLDPTVPDAYVTSSTNCYTRIYEDLYQVALSPYGHLLVEESV